MTDLKSFAGHLMSLSQNDWNRLFALLPILENTSNFGTLINPKSQNTSVYTFPYYLPEPIVLDTLEIIYHLDIVPVFDWMSWEEGRAILADENTNYKELDKITLCQLLTVIIRTDRFSEGYLISCFDRGVMTAIIRGLQKQIDSSSDNSK